MTPVHTEASFETAIEAHLLDHGYLQGSDDNYDRELALDTTQLLTFLQETQPAKWTKLAAIHGDKVKELFLRRLTKELDARGTLDLLRHGVTDYGVTFELMIARPAHGMTPDRVELYEKNRLSVTRQVHYSTANDNSVDMVHFVNGLPVATAELKNQTSGQTFDNAITQYRYHRDPRELLFSFKRRALVHFAVDTDEAFMTTRLEGAGTRFLPFNKGWDTGPGNPPNPGGHRTAYLWEEVWQRDSWIDILSRFIHLERVEEVINGKTRARETLIFPRYHQLDATRRLVADALEHGSGRNYLVMHSAGSGKSNTIAWLAHHLSSLHSASDKLVFDSTIVITDRRVLDRQLQDTIYQFEHKSGVVERIDQHSDQLAKAMETGAPIIISTLQKFPFIVDKLGKVAGKRFAIVVDEAHGSQTGEAAHKLKQILAMADETVQEEDAPDGEDQVAQKVSAVGKLDHVSYFAFTATPKAKTLALFGEKQEDGSFRPFHTYSMRQAIEEGFILDVLQNYTTYKTFYRLEKSAVDDPEVETGKAGRAIAKYMELHPHNISQKIEVIVEHFWQKVMPKIGGHAKAMVTARSRAQAVLYHQAFEKYIGERGYPIRSLVAFSGTVVDDLGNEWTESSMNGFPERQLTEKFNSDDYRVLLVAEKYQTGFDQPLLHTMYVDKRLDGVKAVQTLSRLNRIYPGKDDTFVLDFANDAETIRKAFEPFYKEAYIPEATDPNLLYDLRTKIQATQVLWPENVDAAWDALEAQAAVAEANKALNAAIDPVIERYVALERPDQEEFRSLLQSFVRLYAYLLHIVPFADVELLKLYEVGRFVLRKLPRRNTGALHLDDQVALRYYRLTKTGEHQIALGADEIPGLEGPSAVGTFETMEPKKAPLSQLIERINQAFGADLGPESILTLEQMQAKMVADQKLAEQAKANTLENYKHGFDPAFLDALVALRKGNEELFTRATSNPDFRAFIADTLRPLVYAEQRGGATAEGG